MRPRHFPAVLSLLAMCLVCCCMGCGVDVTIAVQPLVRQTADPVFTPVGGTYNAEQFVTISAASGAAIYYTVDGSTPTAGSMPYGGAIPVVSTETIKAMAVAVGYTNSGVVTANYTIASSAAATPVFTPAGGTYGSAQSVTISDATSGATVYYTTDGSTPTTASMPYGGAISVAATETIRAMAVAAGYTESAVASATYTIGMTPASTPLFTPVAGTYSAAQSVTIADATAGAVIYYTTDGSTPSAASMQYGGAIVVSSTETIEAIAVATGYANSTVASATYTIALPSAATPVFTPPAGTYSTAQSVTISDATAGAVIYYTTDGSTPSAASMQYGGAIVVSSTETIEAIAVATGYANSAVAVATYAIGASSAKNEWTWISGSDEPYAAAVYGTMGVGSTNNTPGARVAPGQWTDPNGNLWMFGGTSTSSSEYLEGYLNDLWKYTTATNEWTWVSGSDAMSATGSYGTLGVAAAGNVPPARTNPSTWTDANGNLWMFGGLTQTTATVEYGDLWEFSPTSSEWTWMGGSQAFSQESDFGTQGVGSTSNIPSARSDSVSCSDHAGHFWLFGGFHQAANFGDDGFLNDMWEYDPSTKKWTWWTGSEGFSQPGAYGTQGTAAAGNTPGARIGAVCWTDSGGNVWIFGGLGYDSSNNPDGNMELNDLWEFNTGTKQWAWMSGSSTRNSLGGYGVQGVAAANNQPPSRYDMTSWSDAGGELWMFGGAALNVSGAPLIINDLWRFDIASGEWTWMAGSNMTGAAGEYGVLGVAAAGNTPGARDSATSWVDGSGNLWLFGGFGEAGANVYGNLSDVWRYEP